MPDINLPGVSSNIDVKGIIDRLVSVEGKKLDRFEQVKGELDREKSAWVTLNGKIKDLEISAAGLHGFRSPFEEKIARSGDESVFTATAARIADPLTSSIKVNQIARNERIVSDAMDSGQALAPSTLTMRVGEERFTIDFPGGTLEKLAEEINRQAGDFVNAKITRDTEKTSVLILEAKKTGEKNRIGAQDPETLAVLKQIGVFEERPEFSVDTALRKERIAPRTESGVITGVTTPGYSLMNEALSLDPKNSVELPVDRTLTGRPELLLKVKIRALDLEGKPPAELRWPDLGNIGKVTVRDVDVEGGKAVASIPEPEKKAVEPEVVDNAVIGLGDARNLERMIEAPDLTDTFKEYTFRLSDILSEGDAADRVLFTNRNTARRIEFRDLVIEDSTGRGGAAPKHLVQESQDAVLSIDGVKVQRETNQIDDAIKGVKLDLKSASPREVTLTVSRDYETITKRIVDLVEKYNDLMKYINEQTRVVSTGRLDDKNEVGVLTGDITVMGMKSRLQTIMMNPYPTEKGKELSLLAQIGISMGRTGSSWSDIRSGYLQVDENKFVEAFEKYPGSIRQLFGSDNDDDMVTDNGVGFMLEKNLKAYSDPRTGIIAGRVRTTDSGIKQQDAKIGDWQDHLTDYRKKLESDFTRMQQALNELEQNQKRIQNFSNQFRNRE
jgi:flagellar hook-associated protein 2